MIFSSASWSWALEERSRKHNIIKCRKLYKNITILLAEEEITVYKLLSPHIDPW